MIKLTTNFGAIVLELFADKAPKPPPTLKSM